MIASHWETFRGSSATFDSPTNTARLCSEKSDATLVDNQLPRTIRREYICGDCLTAAFGHSGWGGSFAYADPDAGLGIAYVMNRMIGFGDDPDPRRVRLLDALYSAL